jgi:hypothetical protein
MCGRRATGDGRPTTTKDLGTTPLRQRNADGFTLTRRIRDVAGEHAGREALEFIRALDPILDLVDHILEDSHAIGKRAELIRRC